MGLNILTLGSSKTYTDESLLGGGAVVGKNVTISSITPIDGGNRVTFSYTLDNGTVKTSTMNVMDGKDGIDGLPGKDGKDGLNGKDGSDGIGISKIEKIRTVDLVDTYRITFTDSSTFDYEVTNGKDGQGGGTADVPIEKIKVNGELQTPVNKVVDITVPDAYDDTALVQRISDIESDYAKSSDIPSLSGYATETWVNEQGFLTEHQDLSGYVQKENGKGLSSNDYTTEEKDKLANLENYDDTQVNADITSLSDRVKTVEDEVPNLATKTYVGEQIANAEHLKREIVTVLPSDEEASDNIIYMLKVESATGNDKYQEYMKIDGTVQMVGDTSVDLTDYAKTADVNNSISTLQTDKADASDLTAHTDNADVHVTTENKELWNTVADKVDKTSIATTISSESTNDEVIGAKLAYDELQKLESANKKQFNTASGETISINDSADGKIRDLKLYGKSEQKQYSGKNLLDCSGLTEQTLNGVTFTPVYENGMLQYIKANGTATDECNFTLTTKLNTEDGKTYRIVGCPSGGSSNTYRLSFWGGTSPEYGSGTIFTNEDLNATYKYLYINIVSGYTCNNLVFKPMITTDLEATYDDYEPYVGGIPSPNPSYPQEIKSVVNPVVKVVGKNLLNPGYHCSGQERYGISVVENSDGSITINGTTTSVAYVNFKFGTSLSNYHKVKKGKYTLSVNGESLSNIAVCVNLYNTSYISVLGSGYITFETDVDYVKALYLKIPEGITFNNNKYYPQLEIGDAATPYEPYKETTAVLPYTLNAIPVDSGGNVTIDGQQYIADYVDFEKKQLVRRVKKKDLGEFYWNYTADDVPELKYFNATILDSFMPTESHPIGEGFCDLYSVEKNNIPKPDLANNKVAIGWFNLSSTRCCLEIRDDDYTDAINFKNAVKGHYVYYQLATPSIIDLTDEEVQAFRELSTYYPTTNVFVTSDQLNGYAECKYPTTDVSGLASRNESRIAELAKNTDDKLSVIGKCKNLLNPTLQTTTQDGVTCTNNGDGTYTINGTSTKDTWISFGSITLNPGKYKFIATDNNVEVSNLCVSLNNTSIATPGSIFTIQSKCACTIGFSTYNNTFNNVLIKPMITTDLNATYDDFVPYTGEGETLTHDVAKLNSNLVRVDKNTIANLCNSKNGNNILIGQIKANTIYTLFFEQDSETGFNLKLNISDGVNVSYKEISPTYSKTKVICWFSNTYDGNIFFNGWKGVNQRNFMIAEGKFDEWIDYITPTGNSGRLNVDVANLKNDVGSTDISAIGDGTVTGAISAVNDKLGGLTFSASGTTLSITDGTNTWTLEANS